MSFLHQASLSRSLCVRNVSALFIIDETHRECLVLLELASLCTHARARTHKDARTRAHTHTHTHRLLTTCISMYHLMKPNLPKKHRSKKMSYRNKMTHVSALLRVVRELEYNRILPSVSKHWKNTGGVGGGSPVSANGWERTKQTGRKYFYLGCVCVWIRTGGGRERGRDRQTEIDRGRMRERAQNVRTDQSLSTALCRKSKRNISSPDRCEVVCLAVHTT